MKPIPINRAGRVAGHVGQSPVGSVDLLFYRLAQAAAKKLESRFQMPGIWENFVKPIADEKVAEVGAMTPVDFARRIGFLKPGRKRLRRGA